LPHTPVTAKETSCRAIDHDGECRGGDTLFDLMEPSVGKPHAVQCQLC